MTPMQRPVCVYIYQFLHPNLSITCYCDILAMRFPSGTKDRTMHLHLSVCETARPGSMCQLIRRNVVRQRYTYYENESASFFLSP